jgi:hypothetical protein
LVIKALDLDWIRIRIGVHPKMLDPDPGKMNTDPQPWLYQDPDPDSIPVHSQLFGHNLLPGKISGLALEFEAALQNSALVGEVGKEVRALLKRQLCRVHFRRLDAGPGVLGEALPAEIHRHRVHSGVRRALALNHLQI